MTASANYSVSSHETDDKKSTKLKTKERSIRFLELFRYANSWDYCLLTVAFLMTFVKALAHPITIISYSELVAMFVDRNLGIGSSSTTHALPIFGGGAVLTNATHEENMAQLRKDSTSFVIIMSIMSLSMFISGVAYVDIFNHVALKQVIRMRRKFFEATVRKDIGWHDTVKDQNFAVRITDNMEKIRDGISEKIGHFATMATDTVITVVISFAYGWKLTLAVSVYIPIAIFCNYYVTKYQSKLTRREQSSYVSAGSIAEEVVGAIRTVVAFEGEKIESKRYDDVLIPAKVACKWKGFFSGIGDSVLKAMLFWSSAAAFWYGSNLILADRDKDANDKEYTPAVLMIAFFGILVGADHISKTSPFLEAFAMARGSAVAIFDVIDAPSKIDPMSTDGKILNYGLKGNIEFQNVFFRYPSREDVVVLSDFNLTVKDGQTVALVGYSGSGKSTCVQLMQRFYDPIFGKIILDNLDIKQYNISWLRSNMAVVGQEPVLFQGTIGDNIRYGKFDATQKEIEDAARAGGAHDFIAALPDSYDTLISEKGVQLSGGQRQRIAIARALIQNPRILLLDEATSALDYHSERLVQEALDKASKGRTTIVVSHRLSAIRHADRIVFIDHGKVVEEGTHEELMELSGKYYEMVAASEYQGNDEEAEADDKDEMAMQKVENDKNHLNRHARLSEVSLGKNISTVSAARELEEQKETQYVQTFFRIVRMAKPEWCFLMFGTVCAAIFGCSQPVFAIIYAEFYAALSSSDPDEVLRRTEVISIACTVIGLILGLVCFIQTYLFNLAGVCLTTRIRSITFKSVISQEVAWFDEEENSIGALSARLSGDASSVQGAIGYPLSGIIQSFTNFLASATIAFYYSWELALVCLSTSPLMVGSVIFEAKFTSTSAIREKEILEETSRIATETIAQIRTVAGLRREGKVIEEYDREVDRYETQIKRRLRFRGVVNSMGLSIMFFGYGLTLYYGGILNSEGKIPFQSIMKVSESLLYGLMILAQSLAFTPAFTAALIAGQRVFNIIDRESRIQSPPKQKEEISKTNAIQGITYRDIRFKYPTRPDTQVLNGLSLDVLQGKTIALVGSSGCGKSTCVQLLLRYYDPDAGKILINQDDIQRDLQLPVLRRRIGIVSQEPSLFEKTIAENIAYGDTSRDVPLTEIIEAAKMANAHNFITSLPSSYDTCLGAKGTQLSGGQKQRIAIARALVRNPKILLLDEATSALDLQSERIVQSALDEACSGRTCIVIAHRLTTVQNADLICVLQNGRIVEQGNHMQLLAKNAIYAKLHRSQPNAH